MISNLRVIKIVFLPNRFSVLTPPDIDVAVEVILKKYKSCNSCKGNITLDNITTFYKCFRHSCSGMPKIHRLPECIPVLTTLLFRLLDMRELCRQADR